MGPTWPLNPGRRGAAAQWSCFPASSDSQTVHNMPSACDSTNCAMIASTSDSGDPAKINFSRLSTDSLEKRPDSFCAASTLDRTCAGGCIALSMKRPFLGPLDSTGRLLVLVRQEHPRGQRED